MKTNKQPRWRRVIGATLFLFYCSLMAAYAQTQQPSQQEIASPDGKMIVTVTVSDGCPKYEVKLNGEVFIQPSPLGLKMNFDDLTQGLTLKSCDVSKFEDEYCLKTTKQSHVKVVATEGVCRFEKDGREALDVIFRVTSRDVAYYYKIYPKRVRGGETMSGVVESEASGYVLPEGTTTFLCPQMKPMTGFARTAPSYETGYTPDDAMGKNGWGFGYTFPCLFKTPKGWVLLSETGTDGSYVGCRLVNDKDNHYRIGFPLAEEMNGTGSTTPLVALPAETPWRTITIGTTLAPIVETTVATDLVKPKYKASKDYTYGKGSWSWIIGMDPSCNFDEQKRYIDFSAAMGYRSVLVDALWDTQIGYEKMEELARYGKEKGVGLFLWYNSNGTWNDAPQGPRGKMDKAGPRRQEMAWMQKNGILGIKVDFFGGDKQQMMQLYEDILTDANDFGIQVIFHGCTLPRGWERMYPNFVAAEAVLASENLHFGQGACDAEAFNACIHPFIRNTVGSMDFGGSALNKRYCADNQHGTVRKTSDVFAMATAVLFQSSVQHFALAPNNLYDAPAWAIQFMKDVPTLWDETRFIDGYPGKYVILARRSGDKWYIAGVTSDKTPLKEKILSRKASEHFSFLFPPSSFLEYSDSDAIVMVADAQEPLLRTHVETGDVEGVLEGGLAVYKAIPYAAPPVGNLRWRAPQPAKAWEGVRKCDTFGSLPPQPTRPGRTADMMSEDCLYLGIATPAKSANEKLPVMVWIHGGGFQTEWYGGDLWKLLAQRGVVIVSVEYRTGALGFMAHPELSKEDPDGHSGNYGLLDQICALQWVQRNIAHFGGDPSKVTIFGESAGAISCSMLCASPLAKGLFHGCISQSGGSFAPWSDNPRSLGLDASQKGAEQQGLAFQQHLKKKNLKQLRQMDAMSLCDGNVGFGGFWPCVDGYVICDDQYRLYERGEYNDVPVIVMTNSDEGALFTPPTVKAEDYQQSATRMFGDFADEALKVYPCRTDEEAWHANGDTFRDLGFAWPSYAWVNLQSKTGKSPAYAAYLAQPSTMSFSQNPLRRGVAHADDLMYLNGQFLTQAVQYPAEAAVSEIIQQYWVNFAKTGNPNGAGLPYWPSFDETKPTTMQFSNGASLIMRPNREQIDFIDRFMKAKREKTEGGRN
jgi:para-nitrobenzyl esterase